MPYDKYTVIQRIAGVPGVSILRVRLRDSSGTLASVERVLEIQTKGLTQRQITDALERRLRDLADSGSPVDTIIGSERGLP